MTNNFNWAVNKLRQGKKVRRPCWVEDSYWILGRDNKIAWVDGTTAHVHLNQIDATDWEVFEEKILKNNAAENLAKEVGASHVRITSIDKKGKVLRILGEYKEDENE